MQEVASESLKGNACVATVGMFDGVHLGHRQLVGALIEMGARMGVPPVVFTFDRHPLQVLRPESDAPAMLCTRQGCVERLSSLGARVVVLPFSREMASLSACTFLRQVLVKEYGVGGLLVGYDNRFGCRACNDFDALPSEAARLGVVLEHCSPLVMNGEEVSSSRIRKLLSDGQVRPAAQLLGTPYALTGEVVQGRQEGRRLGFATANVQCQRGLLMPREGVYAVRARIDGSESLFPAVANWGAQPTFDIQKPVLEVHLLDFEGSLYGHTLEVLFDERLRDIRRFDSLSALSAQLALDCQAAASLDRATL